MARKSRTLSRSNNPKDNGEIFEFASISANGTAPESRVTNSNDAYTICVQLRNDNIGREQKWARIYKCYKRFPPTDYSRVVKKGMTGLSNVNWGQMEFIVDNQKSSFYDMLTERNLASTIVTKEGNPKEKKEWSELISIAFDRVLRKWHSYLYNSEQDLEELMIAGKGIEFKETRDGWFTKSLHNSDVLIPDRTYADLSNLGEMCIKRSYTPLEFWNKIKDKDIAEEAGWNFWACVDAIRYFTNSHLQYYSPTEFLRAVTAGNVVLSRFYNIRIDIYELYVKEFDQGTKKGKITKLLILQNYAAICDGANSGRDKSKAITEESYRDQAGFLFVKKDWADTWQDIIIPITDCVGSGLWHEMRGLAERVYVQCRQYDITMNSMADAMRINLMLLLKGGSQDATKKLKQFEWLPWMVLPEDINPQQVKLSINIGEAMQMMEFMKNDLYRGIGSYQISASRERTKGEAELDAAESAKLQGTQIKRYNSSQTDLQTLWYKGLVDCASGADGYDLRKEFEDFLKANGVPKKAWEYKNIESIESNMLSGAGSPSFKLMASEKTITLTGIVAANPGQEEAIRDAIAALQGRQNVDRYRPRSPDDTPEDGILIGLENAGMDDPLANADNFRVYPYQNHIAHFEGHWSDAMVTCDKAEQMFQAPQPDVDMLGDLVGSLMQVKGPHMVAHLQYIQRDETKKDLVKQLDQAMGVLQGRVDDLSKQVRQAQEAQQGQQGAGQTDADIEIQKKAALAGIEVDKAQKMAEVKAGAKVQDHLIKTEAKKDDAANKIAIQRAKAAEDLRIKNEKAEQERRQSQAKFTIEQSQQIVKTSESESAS